ncbi:MAG: prepilin-type N-terminal cleavage/methylation domain-containing protein [Planctomycetes bacterium]|nr:prepilin-type N-terminal cleavage/methylation domain-containing protein [Planctomycetota bacterium]
MATRFPMATTPSRRSGMTLIELLVAMTVFVLLGGALVMFLRVGIDTWRVGELRREAFERAQSILDQLESDLSATFPDPSHGAGGHVDVRFISDYDGNYRQRLRFVRALEGEMRHPITQTAGAWTGGLGEYDYINDSIEMENGVMRAPGGLQEVAYLMDPDPTSEMLWRGIKSPIGGPTTLFDSINLYEFDDEGRPVRPARCRPLASGVLFISFQFWGQETREWATDSDTGSQLWWDSTRGFLDPDGNDKGAAAYYDPNSLDEWRDDVFPSRVQVILVLRPARTVRLARLRGDLGPGDTEIAVDRASNYPDGAFQFIRIDDEWISYESLHERGFEGCRRGVRSTLAAQHAAGTPVIYGTTFSRVIRIPGARTSRWGKR